VNAKRGADPDPAGALSGGSGEPGAVPSGPVGYLLRRGSAGRPFFGDPPVGAAVDGVAAFRAYIAEADRFQGTDHLADL